ncbi:MAG: hypothetical protein WB760_09445 [Xanthobacteraceae bacterium]
MKPLALMLGLFGAAILPHECSAQILDNPFSEYIQRDIRMTPDGGNANDANAAIHTIDPWPPYARHTRIPGNGRESVGAVHQMYTSPHPLSGAGGSGSSGSSSGQGTTINIGAGAETSTGGASGGY